MEDKKSILVVDDDESLRFMYSSILKQQGYIVDTAINGRHGLEMTIINHYDMIITDYDMPEMNGVDMCRKLRFEECFYKPIMLHTGGDITDIISELISINVYATNKYGLEKIRQFAELGYIKGSE